MPYREEASPDFPATSRSFGNLDNPTRARMNTGAVPYGATDASAQPHAAAPPRAAASGTGDIPRQAPNSAGQQPDTPSVRPPATGVIPRQSTGWTGSSSIFRDVSGSARHTIPGSEVPGTAQMTTGRAYANNGLGAPQPIEKRCLGLQIDGLLPGDGAVLYPILFSAGDLAFREFEGLGLIWLLA